MALHDNLLEQAKHLARKEPRKPRQASLRRSVSTAYYALFHLLVDDAGRLFADGSVPAGLRDLVKRAFQHGAMRDASMAFSGNLPGHVQRVVPIASPELRRVAASFVELQEARHQADYDLSRYFTRRETLQLIQRTESAFQAWTTLRKSPEAKVYMSALLLWRCWKR